MKGLIITAKHHDGFCLWPSRLTEHSVTRSPWRDGKGDVLRELADACKEYGLKMGVYLSPWDRNHADYARPEYITYYRSQLRELLTGYGTLFEVWFDGANGGDGYYGGARERRRIDNRTYYDWPNTWDIVRQLQPGAVMFSDAGPDVRWVGNESGVAFDTSWYGLDRAATYPGDSNYSKTLAPGRADASDWVPPEVDVSIRPGWFYHAARGREGEDGRPVADHLPPVGRARRQPAAQHPARSARPDSGHRRRAAAVVPPGARRDVSHRSGGRREGVRVERARRVTGLRGRARSTTARPTPTGRPTMG